MFTLASGFAARSYPVDLVLATAEGPYLEDVDEHARVVDLKAARVATGLMRYLRRERPIAMLSAMTQVNAIAVLARQFAGVPTRAVVSEHANFSIARANSPSCRGRMVG